MISCEDIGTDYETKYKALAQALPMGLLLLNLGGEILEVNQFAIDMMGASTVGEVKQLNMLTSEEMRECGVSDLIMQCIDSKKSLCRVADCSTMWGKQCHAKVTSTPILDDSGAVCYVLLVCQDLSEVEELRTKYWKIARTLASIVDSIKSHAIFAKDENGVFQCVNQAYADMFGLKPMDIVGKTDWDFFPVAHCEKYRQDDLAVLTTCGPLEVEEEVFDPRYQENRIWRTIKSAVCDENGRGVILVGIGEDITDEIRRRESIKAAIEDLEALVQRSGKIDT